MEETLKEKIIFTVKAIVGYVDPECDILVIEVSPEFYSFNVKTKESSLLIGRDGTNIGSLEHLVKMMIKKEELKNNSFIIDINGYRYVKLDRLKQIAKSAALRVSWRNVPETLSPMNSFERRIIHMELAESPLVQTGSAGVDPNRAVVISPLKKEDNKKDFNIDKIINS